MKLETATFASGCFWCTEAVFQRVKGVESIVSGFCNCNKENPSYYEVASGKTGCAEATEIKFDPTQVSYEELLEIFFKTHDPTTLNRQQYDVGTQYRSAIFYHNEEQKKSAEKVKKQVEDEKVYEQSIVTEITPFENFYKAEENQQNFYNRNTSQSYCQVIINPKLAKFRKEFSSKLKPNE